MSRLADLRRSSRQLGGRRRLIRDATCCVAPHGRQSYIATARASSSAARVGGALSSEHARRPRHRRRRPLADGQRGCIRFVTPRGRAPTVPSSAVVLAACEPDEREQEHAQTNEPIIQTPFRCPIDLFQAGRPTDRVVLAAGRQRPPAGSEQSVQVAERPVAHTSQSEGAGWRSQDVAPSEQLAPSRTLRLEASPILASQMLPACLAIGRAARGQKTTVASWQHSDDEPAPPRPAATTIRSK
jgi:hypothetical protein